VEGRHQGQADIPLTQLGRDQATRLAERLRRERIDATHSGNLKRAWETPEAITARQQLELDLQPEPRLREINFGEREGS
jgi:broad specificity phosphatase PhoE